MYVALLEHGPQSGYGVAKSIAKANSNTYTAIEALEHRGAVIGGDGMPRTFRAIPLDDVLANLQRAFARRQERAKRAVAKLGAEVSDEGTYRLYHADGVLDRARAMLRTARRAALIDAFPRALEALAPDVETAFERGITIVVKAYAPTAVRATRAIVNPNGADVVALYAGGEWLNMTIDGREALISYFEHGLDHVRQALWTPSRHVAFTYHSALASEIALAALAERAETHPELRLADALAEAKDLLHTQARAYMDEDEEARATR